MLSLLKELLSRKLFWVMLLAPLSAELAHYAGSHDSEVARILGVIGGIVAGFCGLLQEKPQIAGKAE